MGKGIAGFDNIAIVLAVGLGISLFGVSSEETRTDLADSTYNYTVWAKNTIGGRNQNHQKNIMMESVI